MKTLDDKIQFAINLIQKAAELSEKYSGEPVEVAYSGGKDSDVILELTRMAGVKYRAIYKNTTIDPPGTLKHCRDNGVEILKPKQTFAEVIQKAGLPSRWRRACCAYLKEYKTSDYTILGIRAEESNKRKARYTEPEDCRVYSKKEKTRCYLPILWWTQQDIEEFIKIRDLHIHPLYYDEDGNLDLTRRLGCMCCPLASRNNRLAQFKKYPHMLRFYSNNAAKFLKTHPNSKVHEYYENQYEWLVSTLFCDNQAHFNNLVGPDMFGNKLNCKEFLEDYFSITLR